MQLSGAAKQVDGGGGWRGGEGGGGNGTPTLQKQNCNFSKAFGYYSCMTILTMEIL